MHSQLRFISCFAAIAALTAGSVACCAEEPGRLRTALPAETVAYVRIADYGDTLSRLKRTALGQLNDDDASFEFAFHFVEALLDYQFPASREVRGRGDTRGQGWALREAVSLELGEIVWFQARRPDGSLGWALLVDAKDQREKIANLVKGHIRQHANLGGVLRELQRGKASLTVLVEQDEQAAALPRDAMLIQENVFGITSDVDLLAAVAAALEGASEDLLRRNPLFIQAIDRLGQRSDGGAQVEFFIDTSSQLRDASELAGESPPAKNRAVARETSPKTNGVAAVAGRLWLATARFDALLEVECSREQPVSVAPSLFALDNDELSAESWVPAQAASYASLKFNTNAFQLAAQQLEGPQDSSPLQQGLVERLVSEVGPAFGELLSTLDGRFSRATLFDSGLSPPREIVVYAAAYNDRPNLERAIHKWAAASDVRLVPSSYEGQPYFHQARPGVEPSSAATSGATLCMCFLGDRLLIADHPLGIEVAIDAHRRTSALGEQLDYRLAVSRMQSLAGKQQVAALIFARPETYLKSYHDLLSSEAHREWLLHLSVSDPLWLAAKRALEENPLPTFESLAKHFAPCGGFIDDEDASVRLSLFVLRRTTTRKP